MSVANEDIISWDGSGFSLLFDGSDVGLATFNISGFTVISNSAILLTFTGGGSLPGVGTFDDSDVVKFTATSLGQNTAGTFQLYFDGSDVGLSRSAEDIDAVELLPNGHLLISTTGGVSVPGVSAGDEDILEFAPSSLGVTTSGTWSLYFDGSDVGLDTSSEDIDGLGLGATGTIYLSTVGSFSVPGASGADEDVIGFMPSSLGTNTSGVFLTPLFFDGSVHGLASNDISALDIP